MNGIYLGRIFSCSIVNHLRVEKMRTCSKNDFLQCVKQHC